MSNRKPRVHTPAKRKLPPKPTRFQRWMAKWNLARAPDSKMAAKIDTERTLPKEVAKEKLKRAFPGAYRKGRVARGSRRGKYSKKWLEHRKATVHG